MGREIADGGSGSGTAGATATRSPAPLASRPGVFLIGPPNVGKRTLLSRLLSVDFSDEPDSWTGVLCHGWTIETKYYCADVSIWTAQLDEDFSLQMVPVLSQLDALVMVFDMNDLSSFVALQNWVSAFDIRRFEILLCIGNKADLLPGHFAHVEYRRRMQRQGESVCDPHPEFLDYGISETEGSSLLGEEEPCWKIRKLCMEWCSQYNVEFIEACASNAEFDKCLSVDGDIQGVERLFGALSAHMWPGMILKSGDKIMKPSLAENEEYSDDEEYEYELEYERLSAGSDEPWVGASDLWVAFSNQIVLTSTGEQSGRDLQGMDQQDPNEESKDHVSASTRMLNVPDIPSALSEETGTGKAPASEHSRLDDLDHERQESESFKAHASTFEDTVHERDLAVDSTSTNNFDEDVHFAFEDLEQLMSEIGNMRENLRLMPDFQRREMAAKLAMKMAAMFGEGSDEDSHE